MATRPEETVTDDATRAKRIQDSDDESGGSSSDSSTSSAEDEQQAVKMSSPPDSSNTQPKVEGDVKNFISDFELCVRNGNIPVMQDLYTNQFNRISERFYKNSEWPSISKYGYAQDLLNTPQLIYLYSELVLRHILTHLKHAVQQKVDAWNNYYELFQLFLKDLEDPTVPGVMLLPAIWVWDLLDEFVYHYQKYVELRAKTLDDSKNAGRSQEKDTQQITHDADVFMKNSSAWETKKLVAILEDLVKKSQIEKYLKAIRDGTPKDDPTMPCESARQIGYFALVQQCRLQCLYGDYRAALETVELLDFHAPMPIFATAPSCHVSLLYYVGFAYMMMKRYHDATRTFSQILLCLSKSRAIAQYQDRMQDKLFHLLLLCITLSPSNALDEHVAKLIAEKYTDIQSKLQASLASPDDDKLELFQEKFNLSCPKFLTPMVEEGDTASWNEARTRQQNCFMNEVRQMKMLPTITSFMKLYTTLPLQKLSRFCGMDVATLKRQMLALKQKMKQVVHPPDCNKGPLYGEMMHCSDIDFYVEDDKVHVSLIKEDVKLHQVFLKNIAKLNDLMKTMQEIVVN